MSIYETFRTNKKAEREGVWRNFPANKDGTIPGFKLARMSSNNPEYVKRVEAINRQFKTEITLDILTEEQAKGPWLDAFVDTILIEWRNIQTPEGVVIEYTHDNAKKLMEDLPDLFTLLREDATKLSTFRDAEIETNAGN